MKLLRWAFVGLVLSSCGDVEEDVAVLKGALMPNTARFHPRAEALAAQRPIPPRLEVGFPSRDLSGVMLLEAERRGVQTWLTADGATITLQQGFLTSTKGFGAGMAGSDVAQTANLVLNLRDGQAKRFHSFLNGNDEIELHAYLCDIRRIGRETVILRGDPVATTKVEEQCKGVSDRFANIYWLHGDTGKIVQSSQWTGAFLGNLFTKIVPDGI